MPKLFSLSEGSGFEQKNVIIFGAGMSSSVYIDNKKKDILILCKFAIDNKSINLFFYLFLKEY